MRLYSLVNFYLSPIQHGIQTAHCVSEMSIAPTLSPAARNVYKEWAEAHRTIIVLNGGNSASLRDAHDKISKLAHKLELPAVKFHEDDISLDEALTAVAVVVPEHIYTMDLEAAINDPLYRREEIQMAEILKQFRLA